MLTIKKQVLKKQETVKLIKKNFEDSSAVIFYNFSQAENEEIFSLKKKLKEVNGEWIVCKNTLFKKAFENKELNIKENNAFIFCKGDEYKPLKVLKNFEFKKDLDNRIQGGIYQNNLIDQSTLVKWSSLKSRENLLNDFCNLLVFDIVKLTMLLDEMKSNKE
ncbi:MAG: 50S ribosomal protein L10 [Mycoplasmataceae bacterium]|nr:MAG: 50S ribosomal protein L10 [Mycoplasmataceae bacterium]